MYHFSSLLFSKGCFYFVSLIFAYFQKIYTWQFIFKYKSLNLRKSNHIYTVGENITGFVFRCMSWFLIISGCPWQHHESRKTGPALTSLTSATVSASIVDISTKPFPGSMPWRTPRLPNTNWKIKHQNKLNLQWFRFKEIKRGQIKNDHFQVVIH